MRQLKTLSIFLLVALLATSFVACSKDDDNSDFDLKTYIIGFWCSNKAIVYYGGESYEVDIAKTGQFSEAYYELTFQDADHVKFGAFQADENGISRWGEEVVNYSINGDVVTLSDSEGTYDLIYDKKDKSLCIQASRTKDGLPMRIVVYIKK